MAGSMLARVCQEADARYAGLAAVSEVHELLVLAKSNHSALASRVPVHGAIRFACLRHSSVSRLM